ncbi:MAG: ABC transporter substrate-binding protein [Actinomycetota bacterium]
MVIALVVAVLSACTSAGNGPGGGPSIPTAVADEPVRLVFLADLPPSISRSLDMPAFDGMELAAEQRSGRGGLPTVETELIDLTEDPELALAAVQDAVADPAVVGAVIGPFADPSGAVLTAMAAAHMPVAVLAPGVSLPDDGTWRRLVPPAGAQARALAKWVRERARGGPVCVAGPSGGGRLMPELYTSLRGAGVRTGVDLPADDEVPEPDALEPVVQTLRSSGCRVAVWTGGPVVGGTLRSLLAERGLRRVIVATTDAARTDAYIETAGGAAERSMGTCACIDLLTSTSIDAQRFVNDFQFDAGVAPGPYAVEGFDATNLLVDAMAAAVAEGDRSAEQLRAAVAAELAALGPRVGLGGRYAFTSDGRRLPSTQALIQRSRVIGGRWAPAGRSGG